jgi:hypothetical protein
MQFTILLSLAASAAAQAHIAARQTNNPSASLDVPGGLGCATAALGLISSLPTPPPAIVSDAITNPQTNPCSFSAPSSLSSDYSRYSSELLSWASANEDELASVISECPQISSYASMVPICSTELNGALSSVLGNATGSATDATGSTGTETSAAPTGSTTDAGDSGASRQGGAAAVALAVAGVVAAIL